MVWSSFPSGWWPAGYVDDGQPAKAEGHGVVNEVARIVRSAMHQCVGHALHDRSVGIAKHAANATHVDARQPSLE